MPQKKTRSFNLAIGYLRVSTEDQNLGIDAQKAAISAWGRANGVSILEYFEDRCSGGIVHFDRPGMMKAFAVLRTGEIDFLVAARRDRFARDVYAMAFLERELKSLKVKPVTALEDPEEVVSPENELRNVMLDGFSQYERKLIGSRTRAALQAKIARGERLGAPRYQDSERGREILGIVAGLSKKGWQELADELNNKGLVTLRGKAWTASGVRSVMGKIST